MILTSRLFLVLSIACAVPVVLAFLPGLPGDFALDDFHNVVLNPGIELHSLAPGAILDVLFSTQFGGATRVLPTVTFALDYYRAGGIDAATFKATNIALQALTAFVLTGVLSKLLRVTGHTPERARWLALGLALAWAVHPLQVSSVLYVVQRMQTLATLFVLLAMWAYLRARCAQIEGRPGRTGWMLTTLLWAVALACKEDAIMLPAYLLALELTVLRFRAADNALARTLRRGYGLAVLTASVIYLLLVLPHFWESGDYYNRDFSTLERLLSQGRVLCLYLWQILVPLPAHMPFYYDWIQPSRGLLQPSATLLALLLLVALLGLAWQQRHRRPLFALGVFLFFAGHFVTSNVIGLELAFEHRNHFPLIGVMLAVGDLLTVLAARFRIPAKIAILGVALLLLSLGVTTAIRAKTWHSGLSLASTSTQLAPTSTRAWNSLCVTYFELGGGARADNPNLDKAIAACSKAADVGPDTVKVLANIIAFKALRGEVPDADWTRYLERLRTATMTPDNASAIWVILNRVRDGSKMDGDRILEAIEIINQRTKIKPIESAAFGYFILGHASQPERAYPYFAQAVENTKDPTFVHGLIDDLRKEGRGDWAERLGTIRK